MQPKRRFAHPVLSVVMLLVVAFGFAACSASEDEQSPQTAIRFENDTNSNSTYDILLDGVKVGAISPGQSLTRQTTPGQHSVRFYFANTQDNACTPSSPFVVEGTTYVIACSA